MNEKKYMGMLKTKRKKQIICRPSITNTKIMVQTKQPVKKEKNTHSIDKRAHAFSKISQNTIHIYNFDWNSNWNNKDNFSYLTMYLILITMIYEHRLHHSILITFSNNKLQRIDFSILFNCVKCVYEKNQLHSIIQNFHP